MEYSKSATCPPKVESSFDTTWALRMPSLLDLSLPGFDGESPRGQDGSGSSTIGKKERRKVTEEFKREVVRQLELRGNRPASIIGGNQPLRRTNALSPTNEAIRAL